MIAMDFSTNARNRAYEKLDKNNFESPYQEISGDTFHFQSANSSPELRTRNVSINSFLEEAEIVTPASEQLRRRVSNEMRKKLSDYFMNPIQKWRSRRRFPWKLCIQIINIVIATVQMCLFGFHSFEYVKQHLDMTMALSQLFLKDWNADVAIYPPSAPYGVYTIPDFYDHIDNVVQKYSTFKEIAIGPYGYDNPDGIITPMDFCFSQYDGLIFAHNSSIEIHKSPTETCVTIPPASIPAQNFTWDDFSIKEFLSQSNFTLNFKTLIDFKLHFRLKVLFLKSATKIDFPECYKLRILVLYDNKEHDGLIPINLAIQCNKVNCHVNSKIADQQEDLFYLLRQFLNSFVIIFSVLSEILCLRSLYCGYKLARETVKFFRQHYHKELPFSEKLDFIDLWYVNIAISDIMLVFGSLIKMQIEEQSAEGSEYAKCSILLGVGNLLIWVGILRYLGFFDKYNMLILTIRKALPNVLRFLICAIFLFLGYTFCGWIVLGPYHVKFRTLSRTAECLFAIMNGDDMFATFALLDTDLVVIWWFSRLYLYSFLLMFVYVVVSLFISVIMDTYESIKHLYSHGPVPTKIIEIFMATEPQVPTAPMESAEEDNRINTFRKIWIWVKLHSWAH